MKLTIKLLGVVGIAAAAVLIDRKRRRSTLGGNVTREMGAQQTDRMGIAPEIVIVEAEILGLADVDPEGLMGMGEGIDPDANRHAHEDVRDQRERLPGRKY